MYFKLTQEMKQRIIVYSTSFIIAILFFTILNKFKDIKRAIQFIITILFLFPSRNWIGVYIKQSAKNGLKISYYRIFQYIKTTKEYYQLLLCLY